jgi:hypothetical protein
MILNCAFQKHSKYKFNHPCGILLYRKCGRGTKIRVKVSGVHYPILKKYGVWILPELLLITNEPEQARVWDAAGVDVFFVDLELAGKHERQGRLNTVISKHRVEDVSLIKISTVKK